MLCLLGIRETFACSFHKPHSWPSQQQCNVGRTSFIYAPSLSSPRETPEREEVVIPCMVFPRINSLTGTPHPAEFILPAGTLLWEEKVRVKKLERLRKSAGTSHFSFDPSF